MESLVNEIRAVLAERGFRDESRMERLVLTLSGYENVFDRESVIWIMSCCLAGRSLAGREKDLSGPGWIRAVFGLVPVHGMENLLRIFLGQLTESPTRGRKALNSQN